MIGARVSVITVLAQEHGTELDFVQTQHLLVLGGKDVTFIYEEKNAWEFINSQENHRSHAL